MKSDINYFDLLTTKYVHIDFDLYDNCWLYLCCLLLMKRLVVHYGQYCFQQYRLLNLMKQIQSQKLAMDCYCDLMNKLCKLADEMMNVIWVNGMDWLLKLFLSHNFYNVVVVVVRWCFYLWRNQLVVRWYLSVKNDSW